jgi:hypothetical protein
MLCSHLIEFPREIESHEQGSVRPLRAVSRHGALI